MRILLVAPYLPWPLDAGGKYAQFTMVEHLRHRHRFTLVCQGNPDDEAVRVLAGKWPEVRLRCVPPDPRPRPQRAATAFFNHVWRGKEWVQSKLPGLVGSLQQAARAVGWGGPGSGGDTLVGISSPDPAMIRAVQEEAASGGYDLIQLDFVECLELVNVLLADVPRVFVHHQIHFVFHTRLLHQRLGEDRVVRRRFEELKAREISLLNRFDAVLALSEVDAELLRRELAGPAVHCSPFGVHESTRPTPAAADRGEGVDSFDGTILYVGSEYHYPNLDAVNWFLKNVWEVLAAAEPRLRFRLVGEWSEGTRQRLRQHSRAECLGFVPELEPLLRTAILVVPVWIGSGVRTKILQAMMEGAPVVSTTVGSEGIPVRDGREILVRDDAGAFVQAVLALAGDAGLRRRLTGNARRLAVGKFSVQAAGATREQAYAEITAGWQAARGSDAAVARPVRDRAGAEIAAALGS